MTPSISEKQREQRRQQILHTATELFVQQGYDNTSVSDIVRRAGIAQGTFYLYYPSKEYLLYDMAGMFVAQMVEQALAEVSLQASPLERIAQAIYALADYMKNKAELIVLLHTATAASLLRQPDAMTRHINVLTQPLVDWIREGVQDGSIRRVDPGLAAHLVFTLGHDVLEQAFLTGLPSDVDEIIPGLVDFICAGLRPNSIKKE